MTVQDDNPAADPRAFARLVKTARNEEIRQLMESGQRAGILGQIFADMPDVFRADRAGSTSAVVHWCITGRADGGTDTFQLVIADGTCTVSAAPDRPPRLTLTISAVDFVKMVTGNASPRMLFMRGRMKTGGDLGLAMKFPNLFDIPKA
jgi:putative sterol carrier protein